MFSLRVVTVVRAVVAGLPVVLDVPTDEYSEGDDVLLTWQGEKLAVL
eukprot:COSAG05_NODE_4795_length_1368_cov_1.492514_2_plen_46_part_01